MLKQLKKYIKKICIHILSDELTTISCEYVKLDSFTLKQLEYDDRVRCALSDTLYKRLQDNNLIRITETHDNINNARVHTATVTVFKNE